MFDSLKWFARRHARKSVRPSLTIDNGSDLDLSDEAVWSGEDDEEASDDDSWTDVTEDLVSTNAHVREWPGPDVEFTQRRQKGPVGIDTNWSERQIFDMSLQFTMQMVKLGVRYTNIYASQRQRFQWTDTYDTEFICLVGMLLYMGVKHISRVDVWEAYPWGDQFMQSVMGPHRFRELYACLHFVDNDTIDAAARRKDAFWKVRPLIFIRSGVVFVSR
jgi:hypothetical protein